MLELCKDKEFEMIYLQLVESWNISKFKKKKNLLNKFFFFIFTKNIKVCEKEQAKIGCEELINEATSKYCVWKSSNDWVQGTGVFAIFNAILDNNVRASKNAVDLALNKSISINQIYGLPCTKKNIAFIQLTDMGYPIGKLFFLILFFSLFDNYKIFIYELFQI